MKNSCPQRDSKLVPSVYEVNVLTIALLGLISNEHLKVDGILLECAIKIYLYYIVDVVKWFVVYYILFKTLYSQQIF